MWAWLNEGAVLKGLHRAGLLGGAWPGWGRGLIGPLGSEMGRQLVKMGK